MAAGPEFERKLSNVTELPHSSRLPDGLDGLARLALDKEVDVRPVLLRVLTDLYVGRPHHSAEEVRQFETIALGLVGAAR